MDYGRLLTRAWNIVWENKFLILLGVLVALSGSSGGSGASSGTQFNFDRSRPRENFDFPPPSEFPRFDDWGLPVLPVVVIVVLVGVAVVFGLIVWALSTIARGGLIAGVNTIDAGRSSDLGTAWSAGWQKGWRLIGIGLVQAIPGFLLALGGLGGILLAGGLSGLAGDSSMMGPNAGVFGVLGCLACLLAPIALGLMLLKAFANRACMIEDLGVLDAYRRGLAVLGENVGSAILLFIIQVAIGIGLGIILLGPSIFCCLLWPILLLVQGAIEAFFSAVWTLAWREWAGAGSV